MLHCSGLAVHHSKELAGILDALQCAYNEHHSKEHAGTSDALQSAYNELVKQYPIDSMMMYYHPEIANKSRVSIMDLIKPGIDGSLPGYTPSSACLNTIAKGWANGPRVKPTPLIHEKFHEPSLLALVLDRLHDEAMGNAMLVNKEWNSVIKSSPDYDCKVEKLNLYFRNLAVSSSGDQSDDDRPFHAYSGGGYAGYGSN